MTPDKLASRFRLAQNEMRNIDGLQPQEAFDELLKYLFFREQDEGSGAKLSCSSVLDADDVKYCASEIRKRFMAYLGRSKVAPEEWRHSGFRLSDLALVRVHAAFVGVWLLGLGVDIRSAALKTFLTASIRKGLGIFLTPDDVVREIVNCLRPKSGDRIIDPACGSGTFLAEISALHAKSNLATDIHIFGADKNARMAMMAELNCSHQLSATFECAVADSLGNFGSDLPDWYQPGTFDLVLTNPPFGVTNEALSYNFAAYETCADARGKQLDRQDSEIMFIERAISLLRPGGCAGLVLPRSVLTNQRYKVAREKLGKRASVRAVVSLPSETFAATGTQTSTVVLILEKFGAALSASDEIRPVVARLDNVGFDHTGRVRDRSQLPGFGVALREAIHRQSSDSRLHILTGMGADETLEAAAALLSGKNDDAVGGTGLQLADVVELATTGRTPARSAYAADGLFLVKVGNLTGAGIDWLPRERNFVRDAKAALGRSGLERLLRRGDILLTSSAHASKYIAKKVDVITTIPDDVGGRASFVGEVMLLRCKDGVSPFRVAAYLRLENVARSIQDRVRGQTAHLHSSDVLALPVERHIFESAELTELAGLVESECLLAEQAGQLAFRQQELRARLGEKPHAIETVA